jgi:hypothetical protein
MKNVDKIRVIIHSDQLNMSKWRGYLWLYGDRSHLKFENYRKCDNETNSVIYDIPVTPAVLLASTKDYRFRLEGMESFDGEDPRGKIMDVEYELYDVKGVSAESTKNIFLAFSGAIMLIVGLCATPYINPSKLMKKKGWL